MNHGRAARAWEMMVGARALTLQEYFAKGHHNNFDFLRFFAACLVLFGHSFTLLEATPQFKFPSDPVTKAIFPYLPFGQGLPGTGVHIFFFISGLLVTRSFMNAQGDVWRFARARLLRIGPAFWVNTLLVALVLGPLMSDLAPTAYFANGTTWQYILRNIPFWPLQVHLPAVFQSIPFAPAVNGSIWTIPLELQMYVWVVILGVIGVLRQRLVFLSFFAAITLYYCITGASYMFVTSTGEPRLWVFFFWGMLACIYAPKILVSPRLLLLMSLPMAWLWQTQTLWMQVLYAAWFGYALLVLVYVWPLRCLDMRRIGDVSYGIYLYCFPVQQTLISFFMPHLNGWGLAALTFVVTLPIAATSWHWVEKPALRRKRVPQATLPA
ncbi:MAG: acyltransferase [Rickettsiales bacterium]|nr:acyltransferase [Rickettsiales bacterium]